MKTYSVTFLPDEKTVQAAAGKSILEAALVAGIPINSVCGGEGVCGKCRVLVKSGKVEAEANGFLTRREIQRGMALACHTYIHGDVVVEVPLESRISGLPQLASEDAIRFGRISERVGEGAAFAHDPLAAREYLELPEPSITDNIADQERIYRELSPAPGNTGHADGARDPAETPGAPQGERLEGHRAPGLPRRNHRGGGDRTGGHLGPASGHRPRRGHHDRGRPSRRPPVIGDAGHQGKIQLADIAGRRRHLPDHVLEDGRTAQAVARPDRQRHQRPDHRVGHGCQGQVSRRRLHRLRRQHDHGPPAPGAPPGEHPPRALCALRGDAAGHPGRRDRGQDQPAGTAHGPALRFELRRRRRGRRRPGHRHDRLSGPFAPDRPRHERGAGHRKFGLAGMLLRVRRSLLRRGRDHLRDAGDDGRHRAYFAQARRKDRRVQRRGRAGDPWGSAGRA